MRFGILKQRDGAVRHRGRGHQCLAPQGFRPGQAALDILGLDIERDPRTLVVRALADASPRVKLFSLGKSQEGREMIMAAIADAASIEKLDEYKAITNRLADPRGKRIRLTPS